MSWLDTLISGVRNVFAGGALQQFLPGINFGSGFTVTPNPALNRFDVTNAGSAGIPIAPIEVSSTGSLASPSTNQTYVLTSSSAITLTVTGTPTSGVIITFVDASQNWATYGFTFVSQSGGTVRNPGNLASTDGSSATMTLSGASVSFQWDLTRLKWLSI